MSECQGWESKEAVQHYKKFADVLTPGRKEILDMIARAATDFNDDTLSVLDIGCGYGDVTAEILKRRPNLTAVLVDYSPEMINLCLERFSGNHHVKIIKHDLNDGLSEEVRDNRFDVVVSCFSLHHIGYENRVKLYSDIRSVLKDNCIFINGDIFRGDSAKLDGWEFDNWIRWMVGRIKEYLGKDKTFEEVKQKQLESYRKLGDKPGTIWDMYKDLKTAGFSHVDCLLKIQNLAVIVATK